MKIKIKMQEHPLGVEAFADAVPEEPQRSEVYALLEGSFLFSEKMLSRVNTAMDELALGTFEMIAPTRQQRMRQLIRLAVGVPLWCAPLLALLWLTPLNRCERCVGYILLCIDILIAAWYTGDTATLSELALTSFPRAMFISARYFCAYAIWGGTIWAVCSGNPLNGMTILGLAFGGFGYVYALCRVVADARREAFVTDAWLWLAENVVTLPLYLLVFSIIAHITGITGHVLGLYLLLVILYAMAYATKPGGLASVQEREPAEIALAGMAGVALAVVGMVIVLGAKFGLDGLIRLILLRPEPLLLQVLAWGGMVIGLVCIMFTSAIGGFEELGGGRDQHGIGRMLVDYARGTGCALAAGLLCSGVVLAMIPYEYATARAWLCAIFFAAPALLVFHWYYARRSKRTLWASVVGAFVLLWSIAKSRYVSSPGRTRARAGLTAT